MGSISKAEGDKVVELRLQGNGVDATRKLTGLTGHKQELILEWFKWFVVAGNEPVPMTKEAIAEQRKGGASWGLIMVRTSTGPEYSWSGEQKVRRHFEDETGIVSEGQRIGKGGRFLGNDPELYEASLKATGTDLTREELASLEQRRTAAERQRLMKMSWDELQEAAKAAGIQVRKGMTPAQVARKIQEVANA